MAQGVTRCRWAEQTLLLSWPNCLEAWDCPWTCRRDGRQKLLADSEICRDCQDFESGGVGPQDSKNKVHSETR